jgi:hypothetical protein
MAEVGPLEGPRVRDVLRRQFLAQIEPTPQEVDGLRTKGVV